MPPELRPPLREMIRRFEVIARGVRAHQKEYGRKLSTRLIEKPIARLRHLLGEDAIGVSS